MFELAERELQPGEQIFWTESVDKNLREDWIRKSIRSDQLGALPMLLFSLAIFWTVMTKERHEDAELWVVILSAIPFLIFGIWLLFAAALCFKSFFGRRHYENRRPIKGYALTNWRLLCFGFNDELVLEANAIDLKKVDLMKRWSFPNKWKPLCLVLYPVVTGLLKFAELYFLPNFEKSKTEILSAIHSKERSHE